MKRFKIVIILVSFLLLFFIYSLLCFSEPLYVSNFTSDFSLIYENFTSGIPVYKYYEVQINSTIQTKNGYLELLNDNIIAKLAPNSKVFVDINKDTITPLNGESYLIINGIYNVKMFDKVAIFYKGEYFIKVTKNSFLIFSNSGKVEYKGETFEFSDNKSEIVLLKDKYTIKKNRYYNKKLAEFSTDLILNSLNVYESYLDYYTNIILYLLDENNNYINDVDNIDNEYKEFQKLKSNFLQNIAKNKNLSNILIDDYFKLNNFLDLKILNYTGIINNFLNFYYLSQNYINYFYILKKQLLFIKLRETHDPLWNSEIKAQFYLVWNKFKNFEENIYLFKSAINGNLENIFKHDSKIVYYLDFYNKQKNELANRYLDYIDSLKIKENKEVYKNLIRIFIKFSYDNIIINSNINKIFISNDYLKNFKTLLEDNFVSELSIDEMLYRMNVGYQYIEDKKDIVQSEVQMDNYFKMFNYLLINKSIELKNIGPIVSKIKKLYKAIKLNLLTYYKLIDEYDYNIHNFKLFLNSKLKKNMLATYQYEFNTSFTRYFKYIDDINKRINETQKNDIVLTEKYYEIQNFIFKLIDLKYNFYLRKFKNLLFLQKDNFERKYKQNLANLDNIKKKFDKENKQQRTQNFVDKLSISLIAIQEILDSTKNYISYYNNLYSISNIKIIGYSLIKNSSDNNLKILISDIDLADDYINEFIKDLILYKKNVSKLNEIYSLIYLDYQTQKSIEIKKYNEDIIKNQSEVKKSYKAILETNYKINLIIITMQDYLNNLNTNSTGILKFKNSLEEFINNLNLQLNKIQPAFSINDLILIEY